MNIKKLNIDTVENVKKLAPSVYKESMNLSFPFFMLQKILFERGEEVLTKNFSITQSELDVLTSLCFSNNKDGILSPTELYDIMIFSSGGMTKLLKKLESKEYIKRVENPKDKRSKLVQITPLGKNKTIKALKEIIEFEDKYFSKLNQNEQEIFKKLLHKMLDI